MSKVTHKNMNIIFSSLFLLWFLAGILLCAIRNKRICNQSCDGKIWHYGENNYNFLGIFSYDEDYMLENDQLPNSRETGD